MEKTEAEKTKNEKPCDPSDNIPKGCCTTTGCNKTKERLVDEDVDVQKFTVFKKYMQSLSNVADKDLVYNKQFKELARTKRDYWDKKPVMMPGDLQESLNNDDVKAKAFVQQKKRTNQTRNGRFNERFHLDHLRLG